MPFNGSGTFQRLRNWVADATAGVKIRADYHDLEDDGFAAGLSNCITKDGQTIVTQNIPMNSKRLTGLEDPVNDQDAATKKYTDVKVTTGGKLTGDLEIERDHPTLTLDDTDASGAEVVFQHMGKTRWIVRMNADAETGTDNTGSNFDIRRYADDGTTMLEQALLINRADGKTTLNGDMWVVRSATEGAIVFGTDASHYLFRNNASWQLTGGKLTLGGQGASGNDAVTWDQLATKQANLGFTPVQQSGGAYQGTNKVYIGWHPGVGLRAQVDATDLGAFVFGTSAIVNSVRWLHAGASYPPGTQSGVWQDPFPGSVIYLYVTAGGTTISGFQHKYLQVAASGGGYVTVGF